VREGVGVKRVRCVCEVREGVSGTAYGSQSQTA
jgi:hypothetical protein